MDFEMNLCVFGDENSPGELSEPSADSFNY
jgi:hypothetical protein